MKIGNKKIILKNILIVILMLFVLVIIIIVGIKKIPFKKIDIDTWTSFVGDLLGAVISGLVTFIALKITMSNEKKKSIEDRRMSILPYLSYYIVDDKYIEDNKVEKILSDPLVIELKSSKNEKTTRMCKFNLIIENLGLGLAIEPKIDFVYYDGIGRFILSRGKTIINIGDKSVISLNVVFPDEGVDMMTLRIGYFNLIRDYYQQDVEISFRISYRNELGEFENDGVDYEPVICRIGKSKVI